MRGRSRFLGLLLVAALTVAGRAGAEETRLRVTVFSGPQNLGLFVARDKGLFAKRGLGVEIAFTPNSEKLRGDLAQGNIEIAHAAVDNAVAMVELAKLDVVIVAGGDDGSNELYVRPGIRGFEDIRGKSVVVDAPNTAYALQLYKMLALHGIAAGDYKVVAAGGSGARLAAMRANADEVAAMLNPPVSFNAEHEGFLSLGRAVDAIGPYQGNGIFVLRSWASAHPEVLVSYLQAAIEGLRWGLDPANRAEAVAILAKDLKMDPALAERSLALAAGPGGYARDAKFDLAGFANTLKLRAETQSGGPPAAPQKYLDLSYYERALAGL